MKINWSKAGRILCVVFITAILGLFLFVPAVLLLSLSGVSPYWTRAAAAVGLTALAAGAAVGSDLLGRRGRRGVGLVFLAVCLTSAVYVGHGLWRDSLPTVDDRTLLLREYEPCAPDTKAARLEEASTLRLEGAVLPRLDGATALYPVYASFVQAVYPEGDYSLSHSGTVACSNTVGAYDRLINREVDVIFAAAPSQAQREAAERAGLELYLTPIGREAFVFFVNSRNPVTGLTVEEIRGIYSGQITNWSQVGGKNQSIRPFQRAENSGSQSALQRLMGDLPILEPEQEDRAADMGGIIREVASYRNYKNAIGFSFRFYATEMAASNDIRLLALDGVEPTKETIRDGSYPISSEFYAVTAAPVGRPAPRETNSKIAALLDWILSPQGQSLVEASGYVALS